MGTKLACILLLLTNSTFPSTATKRSSSMEGGEGMVAVVRGLQDSNLTVTVYDGGREYTLMPNNAVSQQHSPAPQKLQNNMRPLQDASADQSMRYDSGAQVTDGHYASMYKMTHCNVTPTSPAVHLTEFPPQRAELRPGYGNFEVGGAGSGETYISPTRSNGSYRGGMSWPDKGSVCLARPSRKPDAFANSLRKYPTLSPVRSSEMVERLISYTQAKNFPRSCQSRLSSSRNSCDDVSNQTFTVQQNATRNVVNSRTAPPKTTYEPEVTISARTRQRNESPTRDGRKTRDSVSPDLYRRQTFSRTNDVGFLKEVTKKVKENMKQSNLLKSPMHLNTCPLRKENYDCPSQERRSLFDHGSTNTVNMEIQAEVPTVSKEVATVSPTETVQKTVAVSPSASMTRQETEGAVSTQRVFSPPELDINKETIQIAQNLTYSPKMRIPMQKTLSSVELQPQTRSNDTIRISRSEVELRMKRQDLQDEILEWLEDISICPNVHPQARILRSEVLKKLSIKLRKIFGNLRRSGDVGKLRAKIGKCLKYVPIWYPENGEDHQSFRERLSDELINRVTQINGIYFRHSTDIYRADVLPFTMLTVKNDFKDVIRDWFNDIPIKISDHNGRDETKDCVLNNLMNRLNFIISYKAEYDREMLKSKIIDMLNKIPLDLHKNINKQAFILELSECLIDRLQNIAAYEEQDRFYSKAETTTQPQINETHINCGQTESHFGRYIQPTENELKNFINHELNTFLEKSHLCINVSHLVQIEIELVDILMDFTENVRSGQDHQVREEIIGLLYEVGNLSEHQAIFFTNQILKHLKEKLNETSNVEIQTMNAFQSNPLVIIAPQNSKPTQVFVAGVNETNDFSNDVIADRDLNAHLDVYMNTLMGEIDEWLSNLHVHIPQALDKGYRQVVICDLAGDIIDRHKYLEMNPSSRGSEADEIEHLKYQIFKWINKLVGEDNMQTVEHAPELMKRIRNIPAPVFSEPFNSFQFSRQSPGLPSFDTVYPNGSKIKTTNRRPTFIKNQNIPDAYYSQTVPNNAPQFNESAPAGTPLNPNQNGSKAQNTSTALRQLNTEFDEYIHNWVLQIPIVVSPSEDPHLVEKLRMGLYNGIWKVITKLKFEPAIINNTFYYQDVLDDEIESLLALLPQSPDLISKKHNLKAQLIEKTSDMNEIIKSSSPTYRQKLAENVINNAVRRLVTDVGEEDMNKLFEIFEIMLVVDNYILLTNYKERDRIKANVYKKKLIKTLEQIFEELTKTLGRPLHEIKRETYINDVLSALAKVPQPNEESLKMEADEVRLGLEVEQWFSDLPLARIEDDQERLRRRRLRDVLTKKMYEIENDMNVTGGNKEREQKRETEKILQKLPFIEGDSTNIDFMADELVYRLKNRPRDSITDNLARRKVMFQDPVDYGNFSGEMPLCSTFHEMPGLNQPSSSNRFYNQDTSQRQIPPVSQSTPHYTSSPNKPQYTGKFSENAHSLNFRPQPNYAHDLEHSVGYKTFEDERPTSSSFKQMPELSDQKWYTLNSSGEQLQMQPQVRETRVRNPLPTNFQPYNVGSHPAEQIEGERIFLPQSEPSIQASSSWRNPPQAQNISDFRQSNIPRQQTIHKDQVDDGSILRTNQRSQQWYTPPIYTPDISDHDKRQKIPVGSQNHAPGGQNVLDASQKSGQGFSNESRIPRLGQEILGTSQVPDPSGQLFNASRVHEQGQEVLGTSTSGPSAQGTNVRQDPSRLLGNSHLGFPNYFISQPVSNTETSRHETSHAAQNIQNQRNVAAAAAAPASRNLSFYDQAPAGYSTPENNMPFSEPGAPVRQGGEARRRVRYEETEDEDVEEEVRMRCRCMERMLRRRKRRLPVCFPYDDYEMGRHPYLPVRYPCPYFF